MGIQSCNTYHELDSDIDVEKNLFFDVKLKPVMNFHFSLFHEHIFRSSRSQMFFKIDALKNFLRNFVILRIKMRLQQRRFPLRGSHVMLIY